MNEIKDTDIQRDTTTGGKTKKKTPWWLTTIKIIGWTMFSLVALVIIACTLIVWILNPKQLTPIVEKHASEYLDATVTASRVELTFWHTFPKMTLDIDSLTIVSESLEQLPDSLSAGLPADADSLLFIDRLHGGLNIAELPLGKISLYDVTLDNLKVNLLKVNDDFSNFDIVPTSEDADTTTATTPIPPISINRFAITNANPIKYSSLSDSTTIEIGIQNIDFIGKNAPEYRLTINADGKSPMLGTINLDKIPVTVDGKISWSDKSPHSLTLNDFKIGIDSISSEFSTKLDFADSITVETLDFTLDPCRASYLLSLLPEEMTGKLNGKLDTDMKFGLKARLSEPFNVADTLVKPSFNAEIEIPDCHIFYDRIRFNHFIMAASVDFNGRDIDKSVIDISRFIIDGNILDFDFKGKITTPVSDAAIDARMVAAFDIDRMPEFAYRKFASLLKGKIKTDIDFKLRLSDLSANRFHNIKLTGDIDLENFSFVSSDSVNRLFSQNSCLKFGTNKSFLTQANQTVDSLLTASVKIDSAYVGSGPLQLSITDFKAGVGTRIDNRQSADTTAIIPLGGVLSFNKVRLTDNTDSSIVRLNNISCRASLTRYEGNAHAPLLKLNFDAARMLATDRRSFVMLSKSHFDVTANLRKRRQPRNQPDSIAAAWRRREAARIAASLPDNTDANLDIEVDSGMKAALQRWDVTGSISAEQGRFLTPALPIRNRLQNINLNFSTDSLVINDMKYLMGSSDFTISGTVSNIRRAVTRKRNNTLRINFNVVSDTINVNEISRIILSGNTADNHQSDEKSKIIVESGEIPDDFTVTLNDDTTQTSAFIVPSNVKADIKIKSKNIIYTDLLLHRFNGEVLVDNSIVNLRNLSAVTDIGSLDITALYSAPDKNDIQFGLGMKVNNFHVDKMINLIPAVDSLVPMLRDFSGVINADIAATSDIDSTMNFVIPSLQAAIKLTGDSLVLLDADTFKSLSKWLMFKNKKRNMIDSLSVEIIVRDSRLELFPVFFDIDRYKLGVMGRNDMNMNLDYHISVLKSPMPFKFGINIGGNIDDMKIRLGGAKLKNANVARTVSIADTTRVNLVRQIEDIFRRSAATRRLTLPGRTVVADQYREDTISAADSMLMIKEGFIEDKRKINTDSIKPR